MVTLQLRGLLGMVEIRALHQCWAASLLERQPPLVELAMSGALQHELHRRGGAASEPRLEGADHHVGDAGGRPLRGAAKLGGRFVPHRPVAGLDDGHATV